MGKICLQIFQNCSVCFLRPELISTSFDRCGLECKLGDLTFPLTKVEFYFIDDFDESSPKPEIIH